LQEYTWPGNVRELENAVQRAIILTRGPQILPEDLPPNITSPADLNATWRITLPPTGLNLEEVEKELILQALEQTNYNQTKAAHLLGITRSALIYRRQKHGISVGR